jgi:L-malate glycosyltransferase
MIKVLHITTHTGGGVGTVIENLVKNTTGIEHTIACLNIEDSRSVVIPHSIHDLRNDPEKLKELIEKNDIVVLHWYNNPLLYEFLVMQSIPPCRLIVWAHANNLYPPYVITEKLVEMSDRFIFTSIVSHQAKEYQELSIKQKNKFGVIWSVANILKFYNLKKEPHDTFNIGYAGTIDFNSKLHPDYVEMCSKINIPNVKFIFCSSGPDLNTVKQQVKNKGLWEKFIFTDRVNDLSPWFSQMDVFGYPLYEKHYGTCEQVLGEAMAAGVVPVVLNNSSEYFIVTNFFNGIITSKEKYHCEIEYLYNNPDILNFMSINAKNRADELYNTKIVTTQWEQEFKNILNINKNKKLWHNTSMGSVLFKQSLGKYAFIFEQNNKKEIIKLFKSNRQWFSKSKGSIIQYSELYPDDVKLREWKNILEQIEKKTNE